jgi:hypothetical protein
VSAENKFSSEILFYEVRKGPHAIDVVCGRMKIINTEYAPVSMHRKNTNNAKSEIRFNS